MTMLPCTCATELLQDRSNTYEFTSLVRELEPPGELQGSKSYPFEFAGVEKQHESYDGINVRLRCGNTSSNIKLHSVVPLSLRWLR